MFVVNDELNNSNDIFLKSFNFYSLQSKHIKVLLKLSIWAPEMRV